MHTLELSLCAVGIAFAQAYLYQEDAAFFRPWFKLRDRIEVKAYWLAKPLGSCAICCSGQLALWSSVYFNKYVYEHIACAGMAITFAYILSQWWKKQ